MSSNSSWVPDEDSQTLFSERCSLQGLIITAIIYGVTVSLYFLSFYHLTRAKNRIEFERRLPLLVYITVSFLLATVFTITVAGYTQMAFIDDRNYPGGPNAFENNMFRVPLDNAGAIVDVLSSWFSDALVVWRFKVIYQTCWFSMWILMFFPCLLLAGSVGKHIRFHQKLARQTNACSEHAPMGIMFLIQYPTTSVYLKIMTNSGLPFLGLSLALNIILIIAIVLRLLTFRYHIVSLMGPKYGTRYTSVAAMIVESAALYSVISVAALVLYGIGNTLYHVLLPALIQFQMMVIQMVDQHVLTSVHQTVATLLIVFRVAQGKGWTQNTTIYAMSGMGPQSELNNTQPASECAFSAPDSSTEVVQCSGGEESPSASDRYQTTSRVEEHGIG